MWPFKKKVSPALKANLVFCFKDHKGKSYYKFPNDSVTPMERMGYIQDFITEATRGMTKVEMDRLLHIAETAIHNGLSSPRNTAVIGAVIHEMRLRENMINDVNLYYNYLAACYIREDENPYKFNQQAQQEKVKAFEYAQTQENSFFFQLPELKKLLELLNISTGKWSDVIELSTLMQKRKIKGETYLKSKSSSMKDVKADGNYTKT